MLGETFEMVTDRYRYMSEKVQHIPDQITCLELEGQDYILRGFQLPKPSFSFNGGKGMVKISQFDVIDFYLKNFDEHLTISKPTILAKNIIFGGFYVDFDGTIACVSNKNNF